MKLQDGQSETKPFPHFRIAWVLFGIIVVLAGIYLGLTALAPSVENTTAQDITTYETETITVDDTEITLFVADTPQRRTQGLSGTATLDDNHGVLFVFDESSDYGFWMKDMLFAIDMIWLDEEYRVVHIESNVSPDTYPETFTPDEPARYVVELNAGRAEELGIAEGDWLVD